MERDEQLRDTLTTDPVLGHLAADEPPRGDVVDALERDLARAKARAGIFNDPPPEIFLGRYRVLDHIGSGGMGVVYAAHDPKLDRRVALKVMRAAHRVGDDAQALLREAQALAKLTHPNVVAVYDVGTVGDDTDDPAVFVAMEYVDGVTLSKWLTEADRDPADVLAVMTDAGRGLAAAHARGLVHRDFKPDNVMIGRDGRVRVMDFGLARAAAGVRTDHIIDTSDDPVATVAERMSLTQTGRAAGTPAYMAPEQFRGGEVGPASDQFGFCVAVWEAIYGGRPFCGETPIELWDALVAGPPPAPETSTIPPALREVVARGLAFAPQDRWPSMDDLLRALERTRAPEQRRWRFLLVAAVVVVVLASALALAMSLASDESGPETPPPPEEPATPDPARLATSRQITHLVEAAQIANAEIAPDGKSIAYWTIWEGGEHLGMAPSDGGPEVATRRRSPRRRSDALLFTPEGRVLSLQSNDGGGVDLVATSPIDASQHLERSLLDWPEGASLNRASAIAPDGRSIAVHTGDGVHVIGIDGRSKWSATSGPFVCELAWSPDGERLAWIELERGVGPRMVIAAADGRAPQVLMTEAALFRAPYAGITFAGNHHLVFASYEEDAGQWTGRIWARALDDTRLGFADKARPLSEPMPGTPSHLSASADGRTIALVAFDRREIIQVAAIEADRRLAMPRHVSADASEARLQGWIDDPPRVAYASRRTGANVHYARVPGDDVATSLFTASSSASFLLHARHGRLLFVDVEPGRGAGASIVEVATDGASTVLARLREKPHADSTSCAGDLCTTAAIEGDDIVLRELLWSGDEGRVLSRVPQETGVFTWLLAPDGTRGAIVRGGPAIEIVSLRGEPVRRLEVPIPADGVSPELQDAAWTPDGRTLFVTAMHIDGRTYALVRMELDGTYEVVHEKANLWMSKPRVSPDGRQLAFATWDFSGDVWLLER